MPIRITGLNSGLDTESIISALVSSYSYKTDKYKQAQTKLSWKQDAWKTLNTKIYSLYTGLDNLRFDKSYSLKKTTVSDPTKATVSASNAGVNGTQKLNVLSLAQTAYLTGGKLSDDTKGSSTMADLGYKGGATSITVEKKDGTSTKIDITSDTKISDVVKSLKDAGLNASFDESNKRLFISATETGAENDFTLKSGNAGATAADDILKALKLDTSVTGDDVHKTNGADATIKLNGATYTSSSNSFSVNGLNIDIQGVTGDGEDRAVLITTQTDTQAIYDKVKDFLKQYNTLINEMASLYNADSAKGYEPLTDAEREAMSDTEIEKWETKIKDALLRRDDTLSGVMNAMTSAMSKGVSVDGKTYHLSDFGIKTLGYLNVAKNEQNAYHIDGDASDPTVSGKEDRLMKAITEDPDTVISFMSGLATNLYNAIDQKMKSTTLSSVYTVYNDKEMASEYSDYTSLIKKWEDKLAKEEDYYYKKFAAMESALSKLNSETSSLSNLFGGM